MNKKDALLTPITEEIPRILGALCPETGTKTKCVFIISQYYTHKPARDSGALPTLSI